MDRSWDNAVILHLWTHQDPADPRIGKRFLDTIGEFGFVPKSFGDEDPPRNNFNMSSNRNFLKVWAEHPGQLGLERLGKLGFQILVHMSDPSKRASLITFALHDEYFASDANVSKFIDFSDKLYSIFNSFQGNISHKKDWDLKTVVLAPIKVGDRTVNAEAHMSPQPTKGLPGVFWANYFGPPFVKFYSKSKLEKAPNYQRRELPDGGYLILTSHSPLDYAKPETKRLEQALIEHLGKDSVFDKRYPDRVLTSPFTSDCNRNHSTVPKSSLPNRLPSDLAFCPTCGEQTRIEETSRDPINNMVGFNCLNCGAIWAVHASLLQAH